MAKPQPLWGFDYHRDYSMGRSYSAIFYQNLPKIKRRSEQPEINLKIRQEYFSHDYFHDLAKKVSQEKPIWEVKLKFDTDMNFAEAIEFFKSLTDPSKSRISVEYWKRIISMVHSVGDLSFQDLTQNLIQRINSSKYISMRIIGSSQSIDGELCDNVPVIDYENGISFKRRKTVEYSSYHTHMDEKTLDALLDKASFKLSLEDIEVLRKMIWQT